MTRRIVGNACAAAVLAASVAAAQGLGAQSPTQAPQGNSQQPPADRAAAPSPRTQSDQQVTLTGCVMREGSSDFVLASAMPSGASANVAGGVTGSTSAGATGTSGTSQTSATAGTGTAATRYRLSGERDLAQYVGQRVEIVGRTDASAASTAASDSAGVNSTSPASATAAGASTTSPNTATDRPAPATTASGATSDSTRGTTGTSTSTTATGSATSSAATTRGSATGQAAMQHVTITSVRTIGGSCQ